MPKITWHYNGRISDNWRSGNQSEWVMSFHPNKCIRFLRTRNKKMINRDYILHEQTLQTVSTAGYLDITSQSNLGWDKHITTCAPPKLPTSCSGSWDGT